MQASWNKEMKDSDLVFVFHLDNLRYNWRLSAMLQRSFLPTEGKVHLDTKIETKISTQAKDFLEDAANTREQEPVRSSYEKKQYNEYMIYLLGQLLDDNKAEGKRLHSVGSEGAEDKAGFGD